GRSGLLLARRQEVRLQWLFLLERLGFLPYPSPPFQGKTSAKHACSQAPAHVLQEKRPHDLFPKAFARRAAKRVGSRGLELSERLVQTGLPPTEQSRRHLLQ